MMHGFLNSAVASLKCLKWSPVGRDGSKGLVMDLGMFVTLATVNLLNSYQPPQGEVRLLSYRLGRLQRNICFQHLSPTTSEKRKRDC